MKSHIFGVLVAALFWTAAVPAATVSTIFTLDPATAAANRLTLSIGGGSADTDLSGTIDALIEIDFATGVISSLEFVGGGITTTDWLIASVPALGGASLETEGSTATADSTPPLTGVDPAGNFDATEHLILLTGGTTTARNVPLTDGPVETSLANTPIPGTGTGTLLATRSGDQFDLVLTMNINETLSLVDQDLNILGSVVAQGSITAIPEPAMSFALCGAVAGLCLTRRRRVS